MGLSLKVAVPAMAFLAGSTFAQEPEPAVDPIVHNWPQSLEATERMIRDILDEHDDVIAEVRSVECTPTACEVHLTQRDGASLMGLYSEVLSPEFVSLGSGSGFMRRDLLGTGNYEYVIGMAAPSGPYERNSDVEVSSSENPDSAAEAGNDRTWADLKLSPEEAEWFNVPFEERQRRFLAEGRDLTWAASMERAIAEEVASWDRPQVQLHTAECRVTMCRIATYWPPNPYTAQLGQQQSYLYALGLDHQGEVHGVDEGNGYLSVMIARRR